MAVLEVSRPARRRAAIRESLPTDHPAVLDEIEELLALGHAGAEYDAWLIEIGKGGQTLTEKWSDGMATLHGMATHGFPNMFFLNNSQAAFTANFPHHMDEQSRHISHILMHCFRDGKRRIEVTRDAEEKWVAEIVKLGKMSVKFLESCTPGYYNNEG